LYRQVEEKSMERALFKIPSTFDFYNKLCHARCADRHRAPSISERLSSVP
jgi:hypothetical protein